MQVYFKDVQKVSLYRKPFKMTAIKMIDFAGNSHLFRTILICCHRCRCQSFQLMAWTVIRASS